MPAAKQFSNEEIELIKSLAEHGECVTAIALYLNVDRRVIYRILEQYKITLVSSIKNNQGKKDLWTTTKLRNLIKYYKSDKISLDEISKILGISKRSIVRKAKELNISKVAVIRKDSLNDTDIEYLKANAGKKTILELANDLDCCSETISKKFKELGICERKGKKILYKDNVKFMDDLANPQLSIADISRKYGYSTSFISHKRKECFPDYKKQINTYLHKSTYEIDFENNVLDKLNITYEYQKYIGKWRVDYYLGLNIIIEVQGDYWHDNEKVKERDNRKKDELEKENYQILYIYKNDIYENVDDTINKIKQIYKCAVSTQFAT